MGFFGILSEGSASDFEVSKFDLNIWCLPRPLGRHCFFCDLGIELTPKTAPLQGFSITAPFKSSNIKDLSWCLGRSDIAGLVLGEPVDILDGGRTIQFKDEKLYVAHLDIAGTRLDEARSTAGFSLWNIRLTPAIPSGKKSYLRIRLEVSSLGRFWVWQPSRGRGKEAVADVRVADLREAAVMEDAHDYASRLVDIARMNCFIIVPVSFERRLCSPDVRYLRLLEGSVWRDYLPVHFGKDKLLVHYWRADQVKADAAFRGLLHVAGTPPRVRLDTLLAAISSAILVGIFLSTPDAISRGTGARLTLYFYQSAKSWWVLVAASLSALILWMIGNVDTTRMIFTAVRRFFRRLWQKKSRTSG